MASIKISEKKNYFRMAKAYSYGIFHTSKESRVTVINEVIPFRIKLTNLGITSNYSPGNAAPIGIAIIGLNNYVM